MAFPGRMADHTKHVFILLSVLTFVPVAVSLCAQYLFDIAPCTLCVIERWPYIISFFLGLTAFFCQARSKSILGLMVIIFFSGFFISVYHILIEQGVLPGSQACGGEAEGFKGTSTEELEAYLKTVPTRRCDQTPKLFGLISWAVLNCVYSLLLALYGFISLKNLLRKKFSK